MPGDIDRDTLHKTKGIEVGHVFQLGTKYSSLMNASYMSEEGKEIPLVMGCYGIGVSRLVQAIVQQSHDKDGIIWPISIAPYHVVIVVPNMSNNSQVTIAESLYKELQEADVDVLLDDRDERIGIKFKDADLIGIPYRLVIGRSIQVGKVELVNRKTKGIQEVYISDVVSVLLEEIQEV